MDDRRFDSLARSLAAPLTRRGLLGGLAAVAAGARARGAAAQPDCPIPGQTRNRRGQCSCPAGTDPCPDGCADKKRDPSNCGSCGNVCLPGEICQAGNCACPPGATCGCPAGTVPCADGSCADATDPTNCGCARERCPLNETCIDGACSCQGIGSVAPATCCPEGSGPVSTCAFPGENVIRNAATCAFGFGCPEGTTPCVGVEGDPNDQYDTCQVCCPVGTTCDPLGFCRQ